MAMMVIVIKYLQGRKISSKVTGLTGECMDLATVLGLHHVAEVEGKTDWPIRTCQGQYLPAKTAFARVYPV
jgi:hypothetical protein